MKTIPTIEVTGHKPVKLNRHAASAILRANRAYHSVNRIDGMLSDSKTYAVNYFTTTATIRIEK